MDQMRVGVWNDYFTKLAEAERNLKSDMNKVHSFSTENYPHVCSDCGLIRHIEASTIIRDEDDTLLCESYIYSYQFPDSDQLYTKYAELACKGE